MNSFALTTQLTAYNYTVASLTFDLFWDSATSFAALLRDVHESQKDVTVNYEAKGATFTRSFRLKNSTPYAQYKKALISNYSNSCKIRRDIHHPHESM